MFTSFKIKCSHSRIKIIFILFLIWRLFFKLELPLSYDFNCLFNCSWSLIITFDITTHANIHNIIVIIIVFFFINYTITYHNSYWRKTCTSCFHEKNTVYPLFCEMLTKWEVKFSLCIIFAGWKNMRRNITVSYCKKYR